MAGNDKETGNCTCMSSFSLNETSGQCYLNCSLIRFSSHKLAKGKTNQCECNSSYRWDPVIYNCVPSYSKDNLGLALGLGLGIPLGLLALAGLGYWLYTCRKPSPPIPVQQPGVLKTEQNMGIPSTTNIDTERALKPSQQYPTSSYQYGGRPSVSGGTIPPPPVIGPNLHSNLQTSAVVAGPPPSGLLPNQSNLGVMTTTTQRTVIEPIAGQAYNISGAIANDVYNTTSQGAQGSYNTISQGMQGAYNSASQGIQGAVNTAQTSAQNMYGQTRDGVSAAAASLGKRMTGS